MSLNQEQYTEWKEHPVTKEVFKSVEEMRDDLLKCFAKGVTVGQHADVTHGLTNKMLGQIEGLNQILNIEFEE